ncbi:uncharacterized protein MYCFIDRAFT_173093 [Pseudocercospora fijiensis CIRAD86]|uniref:Uncharacterized protein n=1 Tax=Pseudocercospora fijiensis (strain CIRAD86) TaxID=383855 RepID=M3B3R5_PSEFD|nr:uncharacterized protein MYCFIDRAFT_173093 [Pseudocercospora fijiensis CIRAD86]EME84028.1 hypothetical protein MYCFIDRAFT_173093 [Pseudocercospora fijiensis CIRAD86]
MITGLVVGLITGMLAACVLVALIFTYALRERKKAALRKKGYLSAPPTPIQFEVTPPPPGMVELESPIETPDRKLFASTLTFNYHIKEIDVQQFTSTISVYYEIYDRYDQFHRADIKRQTSSRYRYCPLTSNTRNGTIDWDQLTSKLNATGIWSGARSPVSLQDFPVSIQEDDEKISVRAPSPALYLDTLTPGPPITGYYATRKPVPHRNMTVVLEGDSRPASPQEDSKPCSRAPSVSGESFNFNAFDTPVVQTATAYDFTKPANTSRHSVIRLDEHGKAMIPDQPAATLDLPASIASSPTASPPNNGHSAFMIPDDSELEARNWHNLLVGRLLYASFSVQQVELSAGLITASSALCHGSSALQHDEIEGRSPVVSASALMTHESWPSLKTLSLQKWAAASPNPKVQPGEQNPLSRPDPTPSRSRTAKANAQRHRDADTGGEGLSLLAEHRRRHGMARKVEGDEGGTVRQLGREIFGGGGKKLEGDRGREGVDGEDEMSKILKIKEVWVSEKERIYGLWEERMVDFDTPYTSFDDAVQDARVLSI